MRCGDDALARFSHLLLLLAVNYHSQTCTPLLTHQDTPATPFFLSFLPNLRLTLRQYPNSLILYLPAVAKVLPPAAAYD
ncbi:hypothetical protein CVT26_015547 [Gymnopilus dilepis]|uniref:Secreted protein n=1 Tax=Gymnopilus dilepis TaxID=231916 RepID=A0A409YD51_9AGAR|nr:hypothetical protein CVT26_015547 [Gymnopilus dilepis]